MKRDAFAGWGAVGARTTSRPFLRLRAAGGATRRLSPLPLNPRQQRRSSPPRSSLFSMGAGVTRP